MKLITQTSCIFHFSNFNKFVNFPNWHIGNLLLFIQIKWGKNICMGNWTTKSSQPNILWPINFSFCGGYKNSPFFKVMIEGMINISGLGNPFHYGGHVARCHGPHHPNLFKSHVRMCNSTSSYMLKTLPENKNLCFERSSRIYIQPPADQISFHSYALSLEKRSNK